MTLNLSQTLHTLTLKESSSEKNLEIFDDTSLKKIGG